MSAAHDAARLVLSGRGGNLRLIKAEHTLARFVLAVDPADERLVEDVARALCRVAVGIDYPDADAAVERNWASFRIDAKAAVAVIAQSAGGDRG